MVVPAHGRIDGRQTKSIQIKTRIVMYSNQILRIIYAESNSKYNWFYYYVDSKLIYAESNVLRGKQKKTKKEILLP